MTPTRDHGGGIDSAIAQYGGPRAAWLDLSTGINPVPYPLPSFTNNAWAALPDRNLFNALEAAARKFWSIPEDAAVLAAPGASALIARIPHLLTQRGTAQIMDETYNEHAASFRTAGWQVSASNAQAEAQVFVHPNNPTAEFVAHDALSRTAKLTVIDESFCDVTPEKSCVPQATQKGILILKSFGKFWGLAGVRLGFVIGDPSLIAKLRETLGPWQVSGPAIEAGVAALNDPDWANATRARLLLDAARLDGLMSKAGAQNLGGTGLFQLYHVNDCGAWQDRLAGHNILSRIFPYSPHWLRLGLPAPDRWHQLENAL
jgi:cobalamin biosynthetic protein CobC